MDVLLQYILDHYGLAAVFLCIILFMLYRNLSKRVEAIETERASDSKELVQIAKDVSYIKGRLEPKSDDK